MAQYYATSRGIPSTNLCPVSTLSSGWYVSSQYVADKEAIKACLNQVGKDKILYIVLSVDFSYSLSFDSSTNWTWCGGARGDQAGSRRSTGSFLADIWKDDVATCMSHFLGADNPYLGYPFTGQASYTPFQSFKDFRNLNRSTLVYSVWNLGPTKAVALSQIDKAKLTEAAGGLSGQVCLDSITGQPGVAPITPEAVPIVFDYTINVVDWGAYRAAVVAKAGGFQVIHDASNDQIGHPNATVKRCDNVAIYGGGRAITYLDVFTYNNGAIGSDYVSGDSFMLGSPDGTGAIYKGLTAGAFSAGEPFVINLPRIDGVVRDLFQGANIGDAFFRNSRAIRLSLVYLGDPLYRPFPNKKPPFSN